MSMVGVLAAMWLTSLGTGLAVERLLRRRLPNALLLPLGLCASIVLVYPGYALGAGDVPSLVLLAAVSVLGLVLAPGGILARLNPGWPGAAGLATYALYMAPVVLSGHWTWSGYNFVNDTAFEFLLADHLKSVGTHLGNLAASNQREFLRVYLSNGYPLGTQAYLATIGGLLLTPVAVLYQGVIAGLAAMAAVALATLPGRLVRPTLAALLGFVAVSANLTFQYALQGDIKEIGVLATVCATVALARAVLSWCNGPVIAAALLAIPLAATLATYNAAGAPYVGAFAVLLAAAFVFVRRQRPGRRWLVPTFVCGVLTALLATPVLATFGAFFRVAVTVQARGSGSAAAATGHLGQLLRPLPLSQVAGVWLSGDYRIPIQPQPAALVTSIACALTLVLLVPGAMIALRRREPALAMLLATMGLVLLIVYPRVSAYADGKLLAIASPAVVLVAGAAVFSCAGRLRPLGLLAGVALALAVGVSDVLAYRNDHIAPVQRMAAMMAAANHLSGRGLVLWNEGEDYVKYFGNRAQIDEPFEPYTPAQAGLRRPANLFGNYFDLDAEQLSFVESFPNIVTRRSPAASRPPANYSLVYENRYYLAWQRMAHPSVLRHLPEQQTQSATGTASCADLRSLVAGAPTGSMLAVAYVPRTSQFSALRARDRSIGWGLDVTQPDTILTETPGRASGILSVPAGRYTAWVQGAFPVPIQVQVDGHAVGSVYGEQGPGQWLLAASLQLRGGPHVVRVLRPGGNLRFRPGAGATGTIGDVALQSETPRRLQTLEPRRWRTLCGARVDWVELVGP